MKVDVYGPPALADVNFRIPERELKEMMWPTACAILWSWNPGKGVERTTPLTAGISIQLRIPERELKVISAYSMLRATLPRIPERELKGP